MNRIIPFSDSHWVAQSHQSSCTYCLPLLDYSWCTRSLTFISMSTQHFQYRIGFKDKVAQYIETSVTYMETFAVDRCSKPPSLRPISRLSDCQVSWLWTEETAVKITPLPLTPRSLWGASMIAWLRSGIFTAFLCRLCFSPSTFLTDQRVRNTLCDQFMEFTQSAVGGRHMLQLCRGVGKTGWISHNYRLKLELNKSHTNCWRKEAAFFSG